MSELENAVEPILIPLATQPHELTLEAMGVLGQWIALKIIIARCGAGGWETRYLRHAATVGRSPIVTPQHRFKNIQSVAFGIGDLFVFVLHTTVDGVLNSNPIESEAVVRIFPIVGSRNWPPPRSHTVSEANSMANTLDRLFKGPGCA